MNRRFIYCSVLLIIIVFCLTGCFSDPYEKEKYGDDVINNWFTYKTDEVDFGKIRRKVENIQSIDDTKCKFVEKYKKNYIFQCNITYRKIGETIIPLSETKTMNLYAVFTPNNDTFNYKVYNSSSTSGIWKTDKELK